MLNQAGYITQPVTHAKKKPTGYSWGYINKHNVHSSTQYTYSESDSSRNQPETEAEL